MMRLKLLCREIEIDGRHPLARLHQGHGDIDCDGGFSRAALLVTNHDHTSRTFLKRSFQRHACSFPMLMEMPHSRLELCTGHDTSADSENSSSHTVKVSMNAGGARNIK